MKRARLDGSRLWAGFCLLLMLCGYSSVSVGDEYRFTLLGDNLVHYFPNAQDTMDTGYQTGMPPFYGMQPNFPLTLGESVRKFVLSSLQHDGIRHSDVTAYENDKGGVEVTIFGVQKGDRSVRAFAGTLMKLVADDVAGLGLKGQKACVAASWWCWNPPASQSHEYHGSTEYNAPWAFYLPLGLPLVNQKVVMYLNYPPSDALCTTDYLQNFTMNRWTAVLKRAGIEQPVLYETIVDTHPLAAPGSKQSGYIAETTSYYIDYDLAMIKLLSKAGPGEVAVPVVASGGDARKAWGDFIGAQQTPQAGDIGVYEMKLDGSGTAQVPWLATNHPDVTTYNACPGSNTRKSDPTPSYGSGDHCSYTGTGATNKRYYAQFNATQKGKQPKSQKSKGKKKAGYSDDQLVADEVLDMVAACTQQRFSEHADPGKTVLERLSKAQSHCQGIWCTGEACAKRHQLCIQARLDYDYVYEGNCECEEAAEAFCNANHDEICPGDGKVAASCQSYNQQHCGAEG